MALGRRRLGAEDGARLQAILCSVCFFESAVVVHEKRNLKTSSCANQKGFGTLNHAQSKNSHTDEELWTELIRNIKKRNAVLVAYTYNKKRNKR